MRRSASELIRNLEMRVARLERQASMRTADIRDFDEAFKKADRDKRLKTLDAVELQNGEQAVVANAEDMMEFLYSMGYHVSKDRARLIMRESGKFFILESSLHKVKGHLFVVNEGEIRKHPKRRIGYNFYL